MMLVVGSLLPFFAIMGLGFACARAGLFDDTVVRSLSRYVYWLAFPALLIHSLGVSPAPDPRTAGAFAAYAAAVVLVLALALVIAWRAPWDRGARATFPLAALIGNDAFIGLPLITGLLGAQAAGWAAAMIAFNWAVLGTVALTRFHGGAGSASTVDDQEARAGLLEALRKAATNPISLAAIGGGALMFAHALGFGPWPAPVDKTLAMLAASSTPVGLTALGAIMGLEGARPAPGEAAPVATIFLLKLIIAPAAVIAATTLAGAPHAFISTAALVAACPPAVSVFIQAQAHNRFARGAAQAVVLGTLLSALTLGALAWAFTAG